MTTEGNSLISKLTFLILTLILACLVMLVNRAYRGSQSTHRESPENVTEQAADLTEETSEISDSPPTVNRKLSATASTNSTRRGLVFKPKQPEASEAVSSPPGNVFASPEPREDLNSAFTAVNVAIEDPVASASSGTAPGIVGRVTLIGTPKPEIPIPLGPSCGEISKGPVTTRHYVVGGEGGLANVVVCLKNARPVPVTAMGPTLDQIGCMYEPYVLGVVVGQKFRIKNSDPVLHNIHATPKLNKEFNFGQSRRDQINERAFTKPEPFIRIKCDVHPWMFAYVGVFEHPFFAISDSNGIFRLPAGFPAGDYIVSATHLRAGEIIENVKLADGEQKVLHFQFDVSSPDHPRGSVIVARQ